MIHIKCPACNAYILLDTQPQIGWPIICPSCKRNLEVVWLYPIELGLVETQDQGLEPLLDGNIQA